MFAFAILRLSGWDSSGRKLMMKKAIIAKLKRTSRRARAPALHLIAENWQNYFRFAEP